MNRMKWVVLSLTSIVFFSACVTVGSPVLTERRARTSQGLIGCPASEIEIGDEEKLSWSATCRGQKFYCNVIGTTDNSQVVCTEEVTPK